MIFAVFVKNKQSFFGGGLQIFENISNRSIILIHHSLFYLLGGEIGAH